MELLRAAGLTKNFNGVRAVDDFTFGVEAGSITALIGPNGSGKTVTFNLIAGFYRPTSGRIFFKNREITGLPPYKIFDLGIGRTFQNIRLFPQMTVLDNLLLGLKFEKGESLWAALLRTKTMRREEEENRAKAIELLKMIGLEEKRDAQAEDLSHGQRRLLEIARTLGTGAEFFLLDEPTAGVFPNTLPKLLEIIRDLKKAGKTILFIDHNLNFAMELADRVVVIDHGRKIAEDTPAGVMRDEAVLDAYMGKGRRQRA